MDEETKAKHSRRIQLKENHIQKQLKIAKAFGHTGHDKLVREPHRLAKHNAMDCGNPKCIMCSSEKVFKETPIREKSFNQTSDWQE